MNIHKTRQQHDTPHKQLVMNYQQPNSTYRQEQASERGFELFGVHIDNVSESEALDWTLQSAATGDKRSAYFANTHLLNNAYQDPSFVEIINSADRVFADGSGVRVAAKHLRQPLQDNINGTDLFPELCRRAEQQGHSIFFLGATQTILDDLVKHIKQQYPNICIAGTQQGYFNHQHCDEVIQRINDSHCRILLVGFGVPLQERWLALNRYRLAVPVTLAVGGLFDFYSGRISRAPKQLRQHGTEWLWRLAMEPKRLWRRYLIGNPLFIYRLYTRPMGSKSGTGLTVRPRQHSGWWLGASRRHPLIKRSFDLSVAAIGLVVSMPLLILIALAIKFDSRGPIIYRQQRVGKKGQLFTMYKFRTMFSNAQRIAIRQRNESSRQGLCYKSKSDQRITRVGRWLRRSSLDELPQLWNILRGEMTLVGPRPALPQEVDKYGQLAKTRLCMMPGLTCYWQTQGRAELSFDEQVQLDIKYLAERSPMTDLKIIAKTISAVITGKGAY
ncbi:exopolysaccharide biosynthesis WecB/TagA/CpsF family protein [Sinobacterium caligoides]|uniref:Exopolysaccharide biosynthesis WecB/TagA/CpsF family protein n=1 Tax=Sinobacterium caligoides TaxID=933926 RepID=A0A3N2DNW0_9GAMM|nr:WecB/TagA/CpsF family glycosyltransferase [Sinobacterium caligoides]ROS01504.1 exopolysaccharide biosynthesis WecB/TagA/CpsF family protein [Sinobacterium caligoides]